MQAMVNYRMFCIDFAKFYHPLYLIDLRKMDLLCELENTFMFFIENPRVNIELVSGFFEFYYRSLPREESLGQVLSKAMITYRQEDDSYPAITEMTPCLIFTKGMRILEILIYMPTQELLYIREMRYYFLPKIEGECVICLEVKKDLINVHKDQYHHDVCVPCLVKIDRCPVCRMDIAV